MKKKKFVYVGLAADILHEGHINILKTAKKLEPRKFKFPSEMKKSSYFVISHFRT